MPSSMLGIKLLRSLRFNAFLAPHFEATYAIMFHSDQSGGQVPEQGLQTA